MKLSAIESATSPIRLRKCLFLAHNINSANVALLTSYLDYRAGLGENGLTCILVMADLRLIRVAQAEGLQTLNLEMLSHEESIALISSTG